jgi:hypothetical protein
MKRLLSLWKVVANEEATRCHTSAALDYKKLESRVKAEGLSFITITLPTFARDLEQSLERGSVSSSSFQAFKRKGGLPLFLGGFLKRIFDSSGVLLDVPCIDSIRAIRQLTLMFAKIEIPCSNARVDRAISRYIECEKELKESENSTPRELLTQFAKAGSILWAEAFTTVERKLIDGMLLPRHGPGATADKLRGNAKFNQIEWTERLERIFPYGEYALPSWRYYSHLDSVSFLEPGAERPVKVVTVPKTLKTPRIIAIEPTCMQYMQQAVGGALSEEVEKCWPANPKEGFHASFGFVGFKDQEVNRILALEGSRNGSLATLDLSEASDRVLNRHVELLFARFPQLNEAIQACRSLKADVPGYGEIPLTKFASMGSALCFPVEAVVFTTIVFAAIASDLNTPLTRSVVRRYVGKVRVFGDDIIIPEEHVSSVIRYLEAFGLKVNSDKSFWTGKFRESCGGDYYDGEWVTPVRVRRMFPRTLSDVQEVVSLFSLRNQLYWAGLWKSAAHLDKDIKSLTRGSYPIVETTSSGLGRESVLPYRAARTHPATHGPLVRGFRAVSKPPSSPLDGIGALLKCMLKQGDEPFADPKHLERQGRPIAVGIKHGWMQPY